MAAKMISYDQAAREKLLAGANGPGADDMRFAWAGPAEVGAPHYYRIQGPTFVIEYNNTQNNANHVHSVWRSLAKAQP